MISLLLYIPAVSASLRTDTDDMIARVNSETAELNTALTNFKNYLSNNQTKVANALDVDTLKQISTNLHADNYSAAFALLENAVNDPNLTSIGVASKINQYYSLKQDLINFVRNNRAALNMDTGTTEGIECSFDLLTQIKNSFNAVKPTISSTVEELGNVIVKVSQNELNNKTNVKSSELDNLIDEYKELASLMAALSTKYMNSLDAYAEVFETLGGSEGLFNVTIKKKFREDFNKLLNDVETALNDPINTFIADRWTKLETYVTDLTESNKTDTEKNEIIYDKIDQVTEVNDKFVAAVNEVIGELDIESVKTKLNSILERGTTEFLNAIEYLRDHLILGDYDIELVENHDTKVSINRSKELLILNKLFGINEFKNQIELANNLGTLVFGLGNYENVPNGAVVSVTDNNTTQKEYHVIVKGDVNNNGAITVTDVAMSAYYALDSLELSEYQEMAADINNNNVVTVTDVNMIAIRALEGDE